MSSDDITYAIYFGAMIIFVGSFLVVSGRGRVPQMVKQAVAWVFLFLIVIAGFGVYEQYQSGQITESEPELPRIIQLANGGAVEIPRSFDGHYYVTVLMNNTPIEFVIDTGASEIVLSREDARKIGIDVDRLAFSGRAQTANGVVGTATVRIATVSLGPYTDKNVRASVNGGEMDGSLLGMSYLSRFDKVSIEGRKMVISRD